MCACTEPVRTGIGAVCVEYGRPKWPITMLKHTDIPGTEKCFCFYFWHPMLVRPAMKRLFCLKAKNGLIIILGNQWRRQYSLNSVTSIVCVNEIYYCLEVLLYQDIQKCVLSSHLTVFSTQRHQYTQCPCWFFILERYKFCGQTETEKSKQPQLIKVRQVKC